MGVWEDALREAAAQRFDEVQSLERQRAQVSEQVRALADFVDGMHRLEIRPQRQPFLVLKGSPDGARYRASRLHKIVGWDIGANAVVSRSVGLRHDESGQGALRSETTSGVCADKRSAAAFVRTAARSTQACDAGTLVAIAPIRA